MTRLKRRPKTGDSFDIKDGLDFPCPWCGLRCTVSAENACILHPKPSCEGFDTHDVVDIMKEANRKAALS